jgi:hypothetical protein
MQAAARAATRVRAERLKRLDPRRASGGYTPSHSLKAWPIVTKALAIGAFGPPGERPRRRDPNLHGVSPNGRSQEP